MLAGTAEKGRGSKGDKEGYSPLPNKLWRAHSFVLKVTQSIKQQHLCYS